MNFVEPKITPIPAGDSTNEEMTKVVEHAYRICYKSESRMKEGSESLIYKLLYGGEHGQMIHTSPLEHRRVTLAVDDWVVDAVCDWQNDRGTSFISIYPQKTTSADEHQWLLEGNFRAFFDFIKGYETDEDDFKGDYGRRDEARLVVNGVLHGFFPIIFKYLEPYDDTDSAIDWEACDYIGESTDYMTFHIVTSRDMLQEFARHRTMSPNAESTRYCNYHKRGISFCIPRGYNWVDSEDSFETMDEDAVKLIKPHMHRTHEKYTKTEQVVFPDGSIGTQISESDKPKDGYVLTSIVETNLAESIDNVINKIDNQRDLFAIATKICELTYNKALELGAIPQEARGLLLGCLKTEILLTGTYAEWAHFVKLRNDPTADPQMVYIANMIEDWFKQNGVGDIRAYDCY